MNRIKCLIVDDEPAAREILEAYLKQIDGLTLVSSCKNALEAFQVINNAQVDLVFLDINMPDISGISLAKALGQDVKVIFTTAYREYALEGFDLQAVDYLLKPISLERFLQAIRKYQSENSQVVPNQNNLASNSILVRADRKTLKIKYDEIKYVESFGDYLKIHLLNEVIVTRDTISNIEEKLSDQHFLRIHRSFLVSIDQISSFTKEEIEIGEVQLPISRSYRDQVFGVLNNS